MQVAMKIISVTGAILAALAFHPLSAAAQQRFFAQTGDQYLTALRAQIDRDRALAPIPDLTCGKPIGARYCRAEVTPAVRINVSESALNDNRLYEVSINYDPRKGEPIDGAVFDNICAATIRVFRPRLSAAAAENRYKTALRRAVNAAPSSPGQIGESIVKGTPDTFSVQVDPGHSIICKITSQPED